MNKSLKKALEGFVKLGYGLNIHSEEGKQWVEENGFDVSLYDNVSAIEYFFRAASKIGSDDKYITDKFLLRSCPRCNEKSYFISLFLKYDIKEIVVTNEANVYVLTALLANGYTVEPIDLTLTDSWGKDNYFCDRNILDYGHGLLLKRA